MFNFIRRWLRGTPPEPLPPPGPETYEEAVNLVCDELHSVWLLDHNSPFFHMGTGRHIRNSLGLWDKTSPLHRHMLERFGLCHADDTGMLIINAMRARFEGRSYSPDPDVERCKAHWRGFGLDPSTMEPL